MITREENVWDWWFSAVAYQNRMESFMPDDETPEELNERLQREAAADTDGDETDEEMDARLRREAEGS